MKEFSLKKSLAMLVALFVLGACSTTEDAVANSDWKNAVGGKYVETSSIDGYVYSYLFSDDASEMYWVDEDGADKETAYKIQSGSTATSATYKASYSFPGVPSYTVTVVFKNLANGKGNIEIDDEKGTFELKDSAPSTN